MRDFSKLKSVIIKIGSSSLVNEDLSINALMMDSIMASFKKLQDDHIDVTLVSSGAIACGMHELHLESKPQDLALKQACASIGQAKLMEYYNLAASKYNLLTGQILLNHEDFSDRKRMLHLSNTLDAMKKHQIIPIINENDALAVEEIKVGDNDTLASLLCPMVKCDLLILFSDIDGLYNKNPKEYADAVKIDEVIKINKDILALASAASSSVGTGGMITKLKAGIIANSSGADMIIANSKEIVNLEKIVNGENIGTLFKKQINTLSSRDSWIIFKSTPKGKIVIDAGCVNALKNKKVSILPRGVKGVEGDFLKGSIIEVRDEQNNLIAKGNSKFSSSEIAKIKGQESIFLPGILGYKCKEEVIHASDLVLLFDKDIKGLI